MRIFYDNLIDYAAVTLTPSTEATTLPATNLLNDLRAKVWRTGATQATETLVISLGSAKAVTSVILLDHTLTAGDSTIKIEANTSDSWGSPAFSASITYAAGVITKTFASQTYAYWRLSFTKSAANLTRDIGRIFIGTYYDTTEQPDYTGYQRQANDISTNQRTIGGQIYTDRRGQYRMLKLDFSQCNAAQVAQFITIAKFTGIAVSFFAIVDTAGAGELAETVYVKFSKLPEPKVDGFDTDLTYSLKLELDEQL